MKRLLFGILPFLFVSCIYTPQADYKKVFEKETYAAFDELESPLVFEYDARCYFDCFGNQKLGTSTFFVGSVFLIYDTQKNEVKDFVFYDGKALQANHVLYEAIDNSGKSKYYSFAKTGREIRCLNSEETSLSVFSEIDFSDYIYSPKNSGSKYFIFKSRDQLEYFNVNENTFSDIAASLTGFKSVEFDDEGKAYLVSTETADSGPVQVALINVDEKKVEEPFVSYSTPDKYENADGKKYEPSAQVKLITKDYIYFAINDRCYELNSQKNVGIVVFSRETGSKVTYTFDSLEDLIITDVIAVNNKLYCICMNDFDVSADNNKFIYEINQESGEISECLGSINLLNYNHGYQAVRNNKIFFVASTYNGNFLIRYFDTNTNELSTENEISLDGLGK